jgi:agmatinase
LEDVNTVGDYDVAVVGFPFDGGCTYRSGTRFELQGIRRISALYTLHNYERGIDLRKQMSLCDVGGVFTIPANLNKSFDHISNAVAHIASMGAFPLIMARDHLIGFTTIHVTSKEHWHYSH